MIRERDRWTCQKCGHVFTPPDVAGLDAAHIWSRAIKKVRHDPDNGLALCTGCHLSWAHRNPLDFHAWVKERLGEEKYEALMIRAKRIK
jgi:5-methylcytosine-specific restriction endonuclease McrA